MTAAMAPTLVQREPTNAGNSENDADDCRRPTRTTTMTADNHFPEDIVTTGTGTIAGTIGKRKTTTALRSPSNVFSANNGPTANTSTTTFVFLVAAVLSATAALAATTVSTVATAAQVQQQPFLQWHHHYQQQPQLRQRPEVQLQRRPQRQAQPVPSFKPLPNYSGDEATRLKRQLFFKNRNTEPGVIALTFSLIGGTFADARQAYRNVSSIVRETINEAARPVATPAASTTAEGDQMMAAAAAENEIAGSGGSTTNSSSTVSPVDQRAAGQALSKLFGRNYRGLRRLFDSELRTALKMSPGNVRDFAVELAGSVAQSLRPSAIFTRGPLNGTATADNR